MTLSFEYAVVEVPFDDSLETDSEDFISDPDAAPDVDEDYGEDLLVAQAEYLHPSNDECSASSLSGSDQEVSALKKKLSNLDEYFQEILFGLFGTLPIGTWSLRKLCLAYIPVKHYFELTENRPIHLRPLRMAVKHNEFIWKKLDTLLDAGITVPGSAPGSFSVVIASKEDENLRVCEDYRSLNRAMKADRWPLTRIEEVFDDLCGSKLFTTFDVLSGY